jgi:hypothetical protein
MGTCQADQRATLDGMEKEAKRLQAALARMPRPENVLPFLASTDQAERVRRTPP